MEFLAKIMCAAIVGAVIFADKLPTEKKDKDNSGLFIVFIIVAVAALYAACNN